MTDLHLLSERIERQALTDFHAAAPAGAREALGLDGIDVGDAFASLAKNDPSILLNRTLGLAIDTPAVPDQVKTIRSFYRDNGIGRFFFHVQPEPKPAEVRDWLDNEEMKPGRRWMKFHRKPGPVPEPNTTLDVREIGPEHGEAFGKIVAHGFDLTDLAVPVLAALPARPDWHIFMAFDGVKPAGVGGLFVKDGVGWCDWGATWPDFRGRGAQRAVLVARVNKAIELGCEDMFTETGEAVEGDPQHSYHNIEWVGFNECYLRDNYVPAES